MRNTILILCSALLFSCNEPTRFQLLTSGRTGIDFQNTVTETDALNIYDLREYLQRCRAWDRRSE